MQQSQKWWNQIRSEPTKLLAWLRAEYYGTLESSRMLKDGVKLYLEEEDEEGRVICNRIANERELHALAIKRLLDARRELIGPYNTDYKANDFKSSEEFAANAAKLTETYIKNITFILKDHKTPDDITNTYYQIWVDTMNHRRALRVLAGTEMFKLP